MPSALVANLPFSALAFGSDTRLYRLDGDGDLSGLLVEAWSLRESLDAPWLLELSALSAQSGLDLQAMLACKVVLQTVLADGSLQARSGLVTQAVADDSDGGFARYRLTIRPWIALLAHTRRSQVFQDKTLIEIVESVFGRYARQAQWRWADDVAAHLAQSPFVNCDAGRSYTVQYRETDLDFVSRLLSDDGLGWRIEEDSGAPSGHVLVVFADSPSITSCPEDATSKAGSAAGAGVRFHRSSSQETTDAIQALGALRTHPSATLSLLGWDYLAKGSMASSVPTAHAFGGANAPRLEAYDDVHASSFASRAQAERAGVLRQEASEARHKRWFGRSTVRTFVAGTSFTMTEAPLGALPTKGSAVDADRRRFVLTSVIHAGINNLPKDLNAKAIAAFTEGGSDLLADWVDADVKARAATSGYGNSFTAIRADVPWRPAPIAKPKAPGMLVASVVGADGSAQASGPQEIHTDRLGRIRVRHEFQPEGEGSTWVRVLHGHAGAGMGLQFIPRIGQQVLLGFWDDDIDQPFVQGAVYTGQGEGGVPPTPAGHPAESDTSMFGQSTDHQAGGQGNLVGGHAPAWHGASPGELASSGQRNAAALSGWKTKEFGGAGFNQLVFDDSDRQLRVQFATTQHATQLNLGHLIHQADNHRGSFRGLGFELRTDAYGVLRAANGLLLSSYEVQPTEPAGDNAAGIGMSRQFAALSQQLSDAAKTHETVLLSSHIGSTQAGQSVLSDKQGPLAALNTALTGMVSHQTTETAAGDAGRKNTATGSDKVPHTTDPVVAISARAGLIVVAGQDAVLSAGENLTIGSGQDTHLVSAAALRIHSGQAIGLLAGAVGPGDQAAGKGITLIAGEGDVDLQVQSDTLTVASKQTLSVQSKNSKVDWAAAKSIVLVTKGGASITISGGNIVSACPGKITIKASKKSFVGPERKSYAMPALPSVPLPPGKPFKFDLRVSDTPGPNGAPLANTPWRAVIATDPDAALLAKKNVLSGKTAADGKVKLSDADNDTLRQAYDRHPGRLWLVFHSRVRALMLTSERDDWDDQQRHDHALDAMGATDTLGATGDEPADAFTHKLVRLETEVTGGAATLDRLKG